VAFDQSNLTGALRFGRLLALPMMLLVLHGGLPPAVSRHSRAVAAVVLAVLIASQFAYATYFALYPQLMR
jgi:hypothetical protein